MDLNRLRDDLSHKDPDIFSALTAEEDRQRKGLELIPSENYCFPEVLPLLGSAFTNKYSEGYPGRRYYGGQPLPGRTCQCAAAVRIAYEPGGLSRPP